MSWFNRTPSVKKKKPLPRRPKEPRSLTQLVETKAPVKQSKNKNPTQ